MKEDTIILHTLAKLHDKYDIDFRFNLEGMIFYKYYGVDRNIKPIVFNKVFPFLIIDSCENIEDLVILFNKEAKKEFTKFIKGERDE